MGKIPGATCCRSSLAGCRCPVHYHVYLGTPYVAVLCADATRGDRGHKWCATSMEYSARSDSLVALYASNRWPVMDKGRLVAFDMTAGGTVLCSVNDSMCDHVVLAGRTSHFRPVLWQCVHEVTCRFHDYMQGITCVHLDSESKSVAEQPKSIPCLCKFI